MGPRPAAGVGRAFFCRDVATDGLESLAPPGAAAAEIAVGIAVMIICIWNLATADIGVFTDIGDKISRYRVTCHDIGVFV